MDTMFEVSAENLHDGIPSRIIPRDLSHGDIVSAGHGHPLFAHEFLFHIRRNIREEQYAEDMISNKKKVLGLRYENAEKGLSKSPNPSSLFGSGGWI